MRKRPYIGYNTGNMEVFSAEKMPTKETHPQFGAVIGPFQTKRAAEFMARGGNNPHCRCVADAERLSKQYTQNLDIRSVATNDLADKIAEVLTRPHPMPLTKGFIKQVVVAHLAEFVKHRFEQSIAFN